jgi:hypothetical protein
LFVLFVAFSFLAIYVEEPLYYIGSGLTLWLLFAFMAAISLELYSKPGLPLLAPKDIPTEAA